ncbi:MAG: asparagine synthase-related protein [Planctomycetota bacterium]|nr:asparagine synthase-related protein [Planctomycetota bacterium]
MLDRIGHRGGAGRKVVTVEGATLGIVLSLAQPRAAALSETSVQDGAGNGHFAQAKVLSDRLHLCRDTLGVSPLYYGRTGDGALAFASEVKALLEVTRDVAEIPPGHQFDGVHSDLCATLQPQPPLTDSAEVIAVELRRRIEASVRRSIRSSATGAWLSGGLDSSTMAALARPHVSQLYTFAAGLPGAPDLEYAREVARHIQSEHHEVVVTVNQMLDVLPKVIYHLESFDALLVRSSITNYLVARLAAEHVPEVLSGEGGDELFAGYEYLKSLPQGQLADELLDITKRLHNTALQRVDRSAAAHGLVAHVCFLDPDVVEYAIRIPVALKLRDGVEKWILRRAMDGALPERVLARPKAKFWEGAGVGDLLARHADETVSDKDFVQERCLRNGWTVNSKEELMYYRIFREHFGEFDNLSWMGRTKGVPCDPAPSLPPLH